MKRAPLAISLVERGWQAARTWSLAPEAAGWRVIHICRGWLTRDVRAVIGAAPGRQLWGAPQRCYRWLAWGAIGWYALRRCLGLVVVDNPRTFSRLQRGLRLLGVRLIHIDMDETGYGCWADAARQQRVPSPRPE